MKNIKDYIKFDNLEKEKDFKKLASGKGCIFEKDDITTAFYHNGEPMKYLAYIEFSTSKARGNHYHKKKHENICIIFGNIKARYWLPENPRDYMEILLTPGDIVHILPGCAHSYLAETKTVALEYSPQNFDLDDTVDVECDW